jgi:hypothetical protein
MLARVKKWCLDSESIGYARLKTGIGSVLFIIQQSGVDVHQFLTDKQYAIYQIAAVFLMLDGGISEVVRRRRAGYNDDGSIK